MVMVHVPVLQKEVLEYLNPKPNENFIDATIGEAGHTLAILERNKPDGKVLGIEWDPELYRILKKECLKWRFKQRLILVNDSFANLAEIVKKENFRQVSGILFDLGMSSWHLERSGRGFSFQREEPLDMRYCCNTFSNGRGKMCDSPAFTAEEIVNNWSVKAIEKILKEYGEEKFARRISEKINKERKLRLIKTTFQLVKIIKEAVPENYERGRIHPATRIFQALRIAVNDELNNLKKALPQAIEVLEPGGKLVIISFHSLEDRIVKHFFKENFQKNLLQVLTKKPITPSKKEIKINPRSRSAKLRAAIKK